MCLFIVYLTLSVSLALHHYFPDDLCLLFSRDTLFYLFIYYYFPKRRERESRLSFGKTINPPGTARATAQIQSNKNSHETHLRNFDEPINWSPMPEPDPEMMMGEMDAEMEVDNIDPTVGESIRWSLPWNVFFFFWCFNANLDSNRRTCFPNGQ